MVSLTAPHGPAGSFVRITSVTSPAVISADEGVYVAAGSAALSNVPVPLVVQVVLDAPPPLEPDNVKVLPAHIDVSAPALTTAAAFIESTIASFAGAHGPDVVSVSVTPPVEMSAA